MTSRHLALATSAALLTIPATGWAQIANHSELEQLFGEPVTMSVTGAPQRASEVPAAMTIISGEELRRSGVTNIAEALRGRAGIDVNRFGSEDYEVAIRGGSQPANPRVLVMVNGHQVYMNHYGMTNWSGFGVELSEIRQIEIVKGPVSALYGFNAASGAINIVTYSALDDKVTALTAGIGTDGQQIYSAALTQHLGDRFGLRVSGGYSSVDEFESTTSMSTPRTYRGNVAVDADYKLSDAVRTRLNYSYSDSKQNIAGLTLFVVGMRYRVHQMSGTVTADTNIGMLTGDVFYSHLANDFDLTVDGNPDGRFTAGLFAAKIQDVFKASSKDTIRATVEYRRNTLSIVPNLAGQDRFDIFSGGLMWDHHFSPSVTLNFAGRLDRLELGQSGPIDASVPLKSSDFDRGLTAWSANAGLLIGIDDASSLRLQVARGLQAPSLIAAGIAVRLPYMPGLERGFLGYPGIGTAPTSSAEIGYSRDLPRIGKLTTNIFYTRTTDIVGFGAFTPLQIYSGGAVAYMSFRNLAEYDSYGLEASLNGSSGSVKWRLDYTFDKVEERLLAGHPLNTTFEALTPRHKIGAGFGYEAGPVTLDLGMLARSSVVFPLDNRRSGWTAGLDASASVKVGHGLELFATGENLTSAAFIDNGYVRQTARARVGIRFQPK